MRKQFIVILLALLAMFGLMVSCKNEVSNAGFGEELVSVSFKEDTARGLTATLESFAKQTYYWAYAAQKADTSNLISGQTAHYGEEGEVRAWVKTNNDGNPLQGLGETGDAGYEAYKVPGFSQGYWNFKLYAYKSYDSTTKEGKELVFEGEVRNVVLKSDSVNAQGSHLVNVIVNPVQSEGNGTMVFLTNKLHAAADRISMNTVNSAIYGEHYTVKVLSILSIEDFPVEYVDAAGAKIHEATDSQDGEYTLPAGSYKVTVAFTDSASAPTLNYARGTIVATVYSNLTTTISGDLTEAMTYAEFDGELNPDLKTVTISSEAIEYDELHPTTQVSFSSTGTAKAVTATTTKAVTNQIIREIVATNGTNTTEYNQSLVLTLNVETVESTATTATYEIGMSATLTSSKSGDPDVVTTSDVSEVDEHVTIVLQLQPGLDDVNVLHDGHQMAEAPATDAGYGVFSYNKPTGELTIVTKSFSPFEVSFVVPSEADYVAQVGNLKFLTLADAIAKAASNSTVTLLKSITTDAVFNVINGRLDLAGYTIKGNVTASENGAIIKNGSITGTLTAGGNSALIKDLTVTGKISIGGTGAVLENCTVTGTGDYAVNVEGNATIKSGTYKAATNGKILNGSILIEDGNFKGTLTESASVSLVGGVYEQNVGAYVAEGYECIEVSTGVFKVRKAVEAVNRTTGVGYYYLQDAIDEASSGDEIGITKDIDIDESIVIPDGKSLTIDLTDVIGELEIPRTIRSNASKVIDNNGSLILEGEGSVLGIAEGNVLFNNGTGASLVITGGTYSADPEEFVSEGRYAHNNGNGTWTVMPIPEGTKVRNGNDFYDSLSDALVACNAGDTLLLIDDLSDSVSIKTSDLTIDLNGYTLTATGTSHAIKISECENVTIKNGYVESAGNVFVIGDHQYTIVKWKDTEHVSMHGYHPLSPAKNVRLENITATATGTKSLFYFTNIEDDLNRADKSNPTDNDLYGRYIYNGGYSTEDLYTQRQYSIVFIECTDTDKVTIIGGSYTASAMFGHMCKYTDMGVYDGEIYSDVVDPVSGVFSTDEIGRFLGTNKYLIGSSSSNFVVSDTPAGSYSGKINNNYYCYDGGANDAIRYADFGETVYITEDSNQQKLFLTGDQTDEEKEYEAGEVVGDNLFVVYEKEGISYTGAYTKEGVYSLKSRLVENTDNTYEFYTVFDPVAAVYKTTNNTIQPALTKENRVGYYPTVAEAFAAANKNGQFSMVILLRDYEGGDDARYYYSDSPYYAGAHSGSNVRFDLNGHKWTYTGTNYALISTVQNGSSGKANVILDSKGGGGIYAPNGSCFKKQNSKQEETQILSGTFESKSYTLDFYKLGTDSTTATFSIKGGTFISSNSSAVNLGGYYARKSLSISGGTFKSKAGAKDITGTLGSCTISGGRFGSDPSTFPSNVTLNGTWALDEESGYYVKQ